MVFKLDVQKAIEAAATLLRHVPSRMMSRKRLLALLYIADRQSLQKTGRPIIGGRLVAMEHGPIHSEVYDLIKGGHAEQVHWSRHLANDTYHVVLNEDPGVCALSRHEIGVLADVSDRYIGQDTWDVVAAETHTFSEYKETYHEGTSRPIPLELVIDAVGLGDKKEEILRDAEEKNFFDQFFGTSK